MEFDGNFRRHGRIDVSALCLCVARQPEDAWRMDPFRQQRFAVHSDTETLYLVYDRDFRHANPTKLPLFEQFAAALQPVIDIVSAQCGDDGWIVRCIIAKLRGGGQIDPHTDRGFSLTHARRFHIPLVTNPDVHFSVGDETTVMKLGEVWEINNLRRHGVVNLGTEDRVHLILDWAQPLTEADVLRRVAEQHRRKTAGAG